MSFKRFNPGCPCCCVFCSNNSDDIFADNNVSNYVVGAAPVTLPGFKSPDGTNIAFAWNTSSYDLFPVDWASSAAGPFSIWNDNNKGQVAGMMWERDEFDGILLTSPPVIQDKHFPYSPWCGLHMELAFDNPPWVGDVADDPNPQDQSPFPNTIGISDTSNIYELLIYFYPVFLNMFADPGGTVPGSLVAGRHWIACDFVMALCWYEYQDDGISPDYDTMYYGYQYYYYETDPEDDLWDCSDNITIDYTFTDGMPFDGGAVNAIQTNWVYSPINYQGTITGSVTLTPG